MTTIILECPTHPGNIGAVARSMYTMGLSDLALISPCEITEEAHTRARSASTILDKASIFKSEKECTEEFDILIGTTSRNRALHLPVYSAYAFPHHLCHTNNRTGIIFGHEKNGLSNEILNKCQAVIEIPTEGKMSLNLSHAVQVICYELQRNQKKHELDHSSVAEREQFMSWLDEYMAGTNFLLPHTSERIRTIINKSMLSKSELKLMYSLISSAAKK